MIHSKEGWRKLEWKDFSGKPDKSSSYEAETAYLTMYNLGKITSIGDSIQLNEFEVILEFDAKKSWVKKGKDNDELLVHEQGHFNIGYLLMRELLEKVTTSKFHKLGYTAAVRRLFFETTAKYNKMQRDYDIETNHSKNKEMQLKWNDFFKSSNINF